jgi:hypothetical protein
MTQHGPRPQAHVPVVPISVLDAKRDVIYVKRDVIYAKKEVIYVIRDIIYAKRDVIHVKRDLTHVKRDPANLSLATEDDKHKHKCIHSRTNVCIII